MRSLLLKSHVETKCLLIAITREKVFILCCLLLTINLSLYIALGYAFSFRCPDNYAMLHRGRVTKELRAVAYQIDVRLFL